MSTRRHTALFLASTLLHIASLPACQDDVTSNVPCAPCGPGDMSADSASSLDMPDHLDMQDMAPDGPLTAEMGVDQGRDMARADMDMATVADMQRDMEPAQPKIIDEFCKCPNPGERCVLFPNSELRCQLIDMPCSQGQQCGDGYYCGENGLCECAESEEGRRCVSICENNLDCPEPLECDPLGKKCTDRDACRDDLDCQHGTYCIKSGEPYKYTTTCERRGIGGREVGEVCTVDSDCESAVCGRLNKCAMRCLADSDCADDMICDVISLTGVAYCTEPNSLCVEPCPTRDSICDESCAPPLCRLSVDCAGGDCIVQGAGRVAFGRCDVGEQGRAQCKPNEWREEPDDPYCRTRRCTLDIECSGGAICLPTRLGTREPYCARQVLPNP
jgi:hypothetical protein